MLHMELSGSKKQNNKLIGKVGEDLATKYLKNKKFSILARNYLKKWGEIDIVARETTGKVHFVEVKTVSYETKSQLEQAIKARTWRPEENVHEYKILKLNRAIESWLNESNYNGEWQIDVLAVRIVSREKFGTIKFIPNVILG